MCETVRCETVRCETVRCEVCEVVCVRLRAGSAERDSADLGPHPSLQPVSHSRHQSPVTAPLTLTIPSDLLVKFGDLVQRETLTDSPCAVPGACWLCHKSPADLSCAGQGPSVPTGQWSTPVAAHALIKQTHDWTC